MSLLSTAAASPAPLQPPACSAFYCPASPSHLPGFFKDYDSFSQPHAALIQIGDGARESQRVALRLPAAPQRTLLFVHVYSAGESVSGAEGVA